MTKRKNVLIVLSVLVFTITTFFGNFPFLTSSVSNAAVQTPVGYYGEMVVNGNRINGSKTNAPVQVKGMSFFWSNWSGGYYNSATVDRMVDEFQVEIVRAAYGIRDTGIPYNSGDESKIREVVNAAIKRGIYVIIDWHSHGAQHNPQAAKDFFGKMAQEFGSYDNVIFEVFNEPLQVPWSEVKGYAEQVIPVIRQHSDNLIIVGTPTWSQDVDQAANNPINANNIAYTLHFYAGTHTQYLRDKGNNAMSKGIAIFATEWGSCNANGDGGIARDSTEQWLAWMDQNKISWCNWAINDKAETSSIFYPGGSLSEAGTYLKSIFYKHAQTAEWRQGQIIPTPVTPTPATPTPILPQDIPGKIEAESFASMSGIQIESCGEGGVNIGYTESGDWMDYKVNILTTGSYNVDFRVASLGGSANAFQLKSGNNVLCTVNVPDTGDWQNWTTVSAKVDLQAGSQTLRVLCGNSAWNMNWIEFKTAGQTLPTPTATIATPTPTATAPSFRYGDVNADVNVDSTDLTLIKRYILKIPMTAYFNEAAADVNKDNSIDSTDLTYMKRYILKIIDKFPAES